MTMPGLLAIVASLGLVAPAANALSAPIHISGTGGQGVNMRPTPDTSQPRVGWIPEGASPDFLCFTYGQNIGGVPVWFRVTYGGATGYYASYYDDSHYSSEADLITKYGIPKCGAAAPPPPAPAPSTAQRAINWATPYADRHDTSYNGLCLTFAFNAYTAAGINLRNWVNVPIGSNTYPVDIWGHFTHGTTGVGTPPAGALVFWKATNGYRSWSHVALSRGGGNLVSTSDGVAGYTHYETMTLHAYAIYQGWWLPTP